MKAFGIFVLLCIFPLIRGRAVESSAPSCIASYLRNKGFLGGNKGGAVVEISEDCLKIVETTTQEEIESTKKSFEDDEDVNPAIIECIINDLKKTNYFDRLLIQKLDKSKSKVGEDMFEFTEFLGAFASINQIMKAYKTCVVETAIHGDNLKEVQDEIFKSFFEGDDVEDDLDDELDYCVRKHLLDNNLITFNRENLKTNPKNIETADIDCEVKYQEFHKEHVEKLAELLCDDEDSEKARKRYSKCFSKQAKEKNFIDQLMEFDYVEELSITPEQKEKLREKFGTVFGDVMKTGLTCAMADV